MIPLVRHNSILIIFWILSFKTGFQQHYYEYLKILIPRTKQMKACWFSKRASYFSGDSLYRIKGYPKLSFLVPPQQAFLERISIETPNDI
jgi:hypothetical protein